MEFKHPKFSMTYEEHGVGIPLLLIHGYPLNRTMWQPQLDDLSRVARVITPDLRGYGDSTTVAGIYTMELLARDCAALLDYLDITQPIVIGGLSMGGYIAMAFSRLFPSRLAGMVLISTRAGADSAEAKLNRIKSADELLEKGISPVVNSMLPKLLAPQTYLKNPQLVSRVKSILEKTSVEGARGALLGMKERYESHVTLTQLNLPAVVIHGKDDQIIPVEEAKQMDADLVNSKLVIIPEAGHLPNLEQPRLFNQVLQEFLGIF
jgi:3-oxoadipate enol-lactonase